MHTNITHIVESDGGTINTKNKLTKNNEVPATKKLTVIVCIFWRATLTYFAAAGRADPPRGATVNTRGGKVR